MAIKMSQFVSDDGFSVLVHFPTKLKRKVNNNISGYVIDVPFKIEKSIGDYLKEKTGVSDDKILKAMKLVKLRSDLLDVKLCFLTKSEMKRVELAEVLLLKSKVIVCEYFFEGLIYSEREYFKRLFRNLMKKGHYVILIENDMNFVCETVKKFYLFTEKENYKLITDFYDEEIYKYVLMPNTVSLVKYFESLGHKVDHDITFNETLKSIYRGVS